MGRVNLKMKKILINNKQKSNSYKHRRRNVQRTQHDVINDILLKYYFPYQRFTSYHFRVSKILIEIYFLQVYLK